MEMASRRGGSPSTLVHSALVYDGTQELVATVAPFVAAGIAQDAAVFVAARPEHVAAMQDSIGPSASVASWADTFEWHPHPATRLRAFLEFVSGSVRDGASSVRLVGEPLWPSGPAAFVREWQRYESILNAALAPFPVDFICLYDAASLAPDLLAMAERTHPWVTSGGSLHRSGRFLPPEDFLAGLNPPLAGPPAEAARVSRITDLAGARAFVHRRATSDGLPPEEVEGLVLAVNEVLTNALVHGGAEPDLAMWMDDGRVVCQVDDLGVGISDTLAGWRPPGDSDSGRGLWLARQLVDLLQIVPASPGTSVRLTMRPSPDERPAP